MIASLDGLDAIPWAELEHAYGSAEDVPGILRALARPDAEPGLAIDLEMSIYHQGGAVYPAGAAAVPFLIELAATPGLAARAEIVELVGRFAALQNEMREPWRSNERAVRCRDALVAGHETLVGLLGDDDGSVRTAVAGLLWEYAQWSPRADGAVAALLALDAVEPAVALRVSLRLDGARAVSDARAAEARAAGGPAAGGPAAGGPAEVLAAAVRRLADAETPVLRLACLAARRALGEAAVTWRDLLDAALAPATPRDAYHAWLEDGAYLAGALCQMCGDDPAAWVGLVQALLGDGRAKVRAGALSAAGEAMLRWRSATATLIPRVGDLLLDPEPEIRSMAADLVAVATPADPELDDRLAALLDEEYRPATAVWALARHGDARAVPALIHALEHDDDGGLGPSVHYGGPSYFFEEPPLREALVACASRHPSLLAPALHRALARCQADDYPDIHMLCDALAVCGPAGVGPELGTLLDSPRPEPALRVIEAAGPAASAFAPRLGRLQHGARAHFAVTGDADALLRAVDDLMAAPDHDVSEVALCLSALGPAAASRMTWSADWLRDNEGWWPTYEGVRVADAHWRVTGDAGLPLRVFERVLAHTPIEGRAPAVLATVADMGPAARPLAPLLRACLDRDERLTNEGGWRGIALDEELRDLIERALHALSSA